MKKKRFYLHGDGECRKTNQQPDAREIKQFWSNIWERKEHNRKVDWINNKLEEGPADDI